MSSLNVLVIDLEVFIMYINFCTDTEKTFFFSFQFVCVMYMY
jgi:hypothetical protein